MMQNTIGMTYSDGLNDFYFPTILYLVFQLFLLFILILPLLHLLFIFFIFYLGEIFSEIKRFYSIEY